MNEQCKYRVMRDDDKIFHGCSYPYSIDDYCDDEMYKTCPEYKPKECR
nr:MAG: hypothetical protein [Microvirus sp.]